MHVVTKILVVFATVLSVFLSALVISYSVNADRIRNDWKYEQGRRLAAEEGAKAEGLKNAAREQQLNDREKAIESQVSGLLKEKLDLQTQLAREIDKNRSFAEDKDKATALAAQLASTNDVNAQLIVNLRKDADESRVGQADTAKKNAELEKALADMRRSLEAAENEKRLVREQLAEVRSQIEALRAGGTSSAAGNTGGAPIAYRGTPITGRVDEVSADTNTGQTLAKISLGTNDNVKENMKLYVTRDKSFVANLVIVKTDLRWAIARVDTLGQPVSVQVGDTVKSELQ